MSSWHFSGDRLIGKFCQKFLSFKQAFSDWKMAFWRYNCVIGINILLITWCFKQAFEMLFFCLFDFHFQNNFVQLLAIIALNWHAEVIQIQRKLLMLKWNGYCVKFIDPLVTTQEVWRFTLSEKSDWTWKYHLFHISEIISIVR